MEDFENSEKTIEERNKKTKDLVSGEDLSEQEKLVEPEFTSVAELCKQQGISRETAYKRMKFLQIKPWKKGRRSFLDSEQVGHIDKLHKHYQEAGGFDGFPIPEPTGPWEEAKTKLDKPKPELAVRKEVAVEKPSPAPTKTPLVEIPNDVQDSIEDLVEERKLDTAAEDIKELHEEAQYRAARRIVARETLTLLYESTEKFTVGELKETVDAHKERCRTARRGGQESVQDFLNQSLRSQLPIGRSGSPQ